jgi:hypothetical protein
MRHEEKDQAAAPAKQAYAARRGECRRERGCADVDPLGIVMVILPSRSSSQRALTMVTPMAAAAQ